MTERTWSQSPDDATDPGTIILAQAEGATDLAPAGPLEPTGPLDPTALTPDVTEAAPEESGEPVGLPQGLVEVEEALDEPAVAATPQAEPGAIEVAPLAAGERRVVDVPAGGLVSLGDASFDPAVATYAVSGNDLVVTLANGGVLVLTNFFAPSEVPVFLSVLDGPATPAEELLARAEVLPDAEPAPAAPPEVEPEAGPLGGASNFRAYDQGNIGDPLDPLGPLGYTELARALDIPEPSPLDFVDDGDGDDGNGNGPPPPPDTTAPQVELRSSIEATIGEQSAPGFNPASTPVLPIRGDGLAIPDAHVNNVDQRNLTVDGIDREVFVRFINETSFSIDSLFVHEIGPHGEIQNVRLVFDGANKPGDPLANLDQTPLGTEYSLGVIPAGTKFAFIVVNDGLRLNDFDQFEGGRFEVRDRLTSEPSTIFDFHDITQPWQQPRIVHIAEDGTVTPVLGSRTTYTADASQHTPNLNRLNPDGKGQFVSGWDEKEGLLAIGAEDSFGPKSDRDFDDLVFGVRFGSPLEKVLVIKGGAGLDAIITDEDSTSMVAATITLAGLEGDRLVLDSAVLAGTGITVTQVSATRIDLSGESLIENYEAVISAATIEIDLEAGRVGDRTIEVTVEDPDGNTGSATTTFTVDDNLLAGTADDDTIVGSSVTDPDSDGRDVISGRGGDDDVRPRSGDDFVDGGDGKDRIFVQGPGDNIISGGPQPDEIILSTMPGADTVRITGLSDAKDTIRNFNATEGDRLDLSSLLRDSDIDDANFDHFVRTEQHQTGVMVRADLDGAGSDHRFVDVAFLSQPVGVTGSTDPSTFVITGDSDAQVA